MSANKMSANEVIRPSVHYCYESVDINLGWFKENAMECRSAANYWEEEAAYARQDAFAEKEEVDELSNDAAKYLKLADAFDLVLAAMQPELDRLAELKEMEEN